MKIESPEIEIKETKAERLLQVTDDLIDRLPTPAKILVKNYINLSEVFDDQNEEKIDLFISKIKGVIEYVENGKLGDDERTVSELSQDQPSYPNTNLFRIGCRTSRKFQKWLDLKEGNIIRDGSRK
jgi:hypothetical protein